MFVVHNSSPAGRDSCKTRWNLTLISVGSGESAKFENVNQKYL